MVPFAAFGVGQALVIAARDEDVRRQRIVFPPHFADGCIHFAHGIAQRGQGVLSIVRGMLEKIGPLIGIGPSARMRSVTDSTRETVGPRLGWTFPVAAEQNAA
jgi:hypothetical protein